MNLDELSDVVGARLLLDDIGEVAERSADASTRQQLVEKGSCSSYEGTALAKLILAWSFTYDSDLTVEWTFGRDLEGHRRRPQILIMRQSIVISTARNISPKRQISTNASNIGRLLGIP